ncbi:MAG TPA: hypothetical protein VNJ02_18480 [Vicinamibacterales bacterium]|nr:hypothetical protein [Vicinamibacterales bacterium]
MAAKAIPRAASSLVFSFATFGLFCLVTGLLGFQPRRHVDLVNYSRLIPGVWTGAFLWHQVAVGAALLTVASIVLVRTNRRLEIPGD